MKNWIAFVFLPVLLKFMEQNGRRVALGSREDDIVVLNNIRNTVLEDMKLNDSVVSKEFSR